MRLGSIARECSCARIDALIPMRDYAAHNRASYRSPSEKQLSYFDELVREDSD